MKRSTSLKIMLILLSLNAFSSGIAMARSITTPGNKHNLSTKALDGEERVCIFCHTPHHANASPSNQTPLWSRDLSTKTYDLYASSTLKSSPQQPTGSSRLCLSCHDGTIALGMLAGGKPIGGLTAPQPIGPKNLGEGKAQPDLSNDHPISFQYPLSDPEFVFPPSLPVEVRLEDGMVQCTSCHDPHNDRNRDFLVKDNKQPGSPLCVTCHSKNGWTISSHALLNIYYPSILQKPGEDVFACEACHMPHNAQLPQNLLRGATEKMTCLLTCHNGAAPQSQYGQKVDVAFNSIYKHTVGETVGVHKGDEDPFNAVHHVECYDCHNPHRVNGRTATAPLVSGRLDGVKVEKQATHDFRLSSTEYDICYKCHAESYNSFRSLPENLPVRQYENLNQRERFNPTNFSEHPVTAVVGAANISGLKSSYIGRSGEIIPLDGASKIYCIACHDPHGSNEPHMLVAPYVQDNYPSSYFTSDYALCYRCHDETRLLDGASSSFLPHRSHVLNPDNDPLHVNKIPCSVCHDPHGVPDVKHLINFDTRVGFVSPASPVPAYSSIARSCTVSCHTTGSPDANTHGY